MKTIEWNGFIIRIGSNQQENQMLVESMKEDELWFHLSDYSGPHLVINGMIENFTKQDIYRIACILKNVTKYKKERKVGIDYTSRKEIQFTSIPGQVTLKKYNTVFV